MFCCCWRSNKRSESNEGILLCENLFKNQENESFFSAVVVDEMIGDHFVNGLSCEFYEMILQKEFLEVYYLKLLINLPADIGE